MAKTWIRDVITKKNPNGNWIDVLTCTLDVPEEQINCIVTTKPHLGAQPGVEFNIPVEVDEKRSFDIE